MPRERLPGGSRSLGDNKELCPVIVGSPAMEDAGIWAPVDRFVIHDRELADPKCVGQNDASVLVPKEWTRGTSDSGASCSSDRVPAAPKG